MENIFIPRSTLPVWPFLSWYYIQAGDLVAQKTFRLYSYNPKDTVMCDELEKLRYTSNLKCYGESAYKLVLQTKTVVRF